MAMGDGPLGARGSSQVRISTSTLSRNCDGYRRDTVRQGHLLKVEQCIITLHAREGLMERKTDISHLRWKWSNERNLSPYQADRAGLQLGPLDLDGIKDERYTMFWKETNKILYHSVYQTIFTTRTNLHNTLPLKTSHKGLWDTDNPDSISKCFPQELNQ